MGKSHVVLPPKNRVWWSVLANSAQDGDQASHLLGVGRVGRVVKVGLERLQGARPLPLVHVELPQVVLCEGVFGAAQLVGGRKLLLGTVRVVEAEAGQPRVEVRGGRGGVERERLLQGLGGVGEVALLDEDDAEVEPRVESLRVYLDGAAQFFGGLVELALGEEEGGEVVA